MGTCNRIKNNLFTLIRHSAGMLIFQEFLRSYPPDDSPFFRILNDNL